MSEKYTPDTDMMRRVWIGGLEPELLEEAVAEFDRWLEQVNADAWDEGQAAGISFQAGGEYLENPYRGGGNDY